MVRVLIADDHKLVRESLVKLVTAEGFTVVAEATDGEEVLPKVLSTRPDVVVLDVAMPRRDGFQVAAQLREELPGTKILFMTMHDDDVHLRRAISLDADGFVSKSASTDEFITALHTVAGGESYLSAAALRRVMNLATNQHNGLSLSERENEVLQRLAAGERTADIAEELVLSDKTVKNHLSNIYLKLGVESAAQAVAAAYRMGLVHVVPEHGLN